MEHQRLRPFDTSRFDTLQTARRTMCMAVRAGGHIFLRGQSGFTLDGNFTGNGDPAAQAEQAMLNARLLLEEAGSALDHIAKLTTYVTDRAWLGPVDAVIARHLGRLTPARVGLIVAGLATPEMLVEIDIDAVAPTR